MPADCGGRPGGPGACDEGAAGVGMAGCGDRAVVAMVACGGCRGREAEITHQLAGRVEARKVRAATMVTATGHGTPRRAWSASTTGRRHQVCPWSWRACASRARRALWSVTARTYAWKTM